MKTGQWGYSTNEEVFYGEFATREEAIAEGRNDYPDEPLWVGQYEPPIAPEEFVDGGDLIEKVLCQDEYDSEWADGTLNPTKEQLAELTAIVRKVFGEWIDKHDLRPTFFLVKTMERID